NTANSAGISHNQYTRYDVEAIGLVLNNGNVSQSARQSQLAGQVVANVNLGAEARVILNEVVSPRRSTIAGFTEVVGGKADVIVANPYGITCSGCGFINTDRVTLTTGTPNFGLDGSVTGFSVQRGDILINGGGLNASAQQILDLVARSVKVDGQINTSANGSLGIVTGTNKWSYGSREVTGSTTAAADTPLYALDSTALGGVYAGRIRIIATEAGLGVRMLGDAAASADDFTVTSAGKVEIRSKISAERDLAIASTVAQGDAINLIDASVTAGRDMSLTATQGGATLSGGVLVASNDLSFGLGSLLDSASNATLTDNNKRFAGRTFTQNVANDANISGISYSAGTELNGEFGSLTVGSDGVTLSAGTSLALTTTGDLALDKANIHADRNLDLTATVGAISIGSGTGQGIQSAAGDISLRANNGLTNSGTVTADTGSLTARVNGTLTNSGTLHAATALDIADLNNGGSQNLTNNGTLLADGTLAVRANAFTNNSSVRAAQGATMHLGSLVNGSSGNYNAVIIGSTGSGASTINVSGSLDNYGAIHASDDLSITAAGITNRSTGGLSSLDTLNVTATGSSNINNYGALYAANAITLAGRGITNHSGTGTIDSGGTITTTSADFTNNNAIVANGNITITATNSFKNETVVNGTTISKGWGAIFNTRNWRENQIAEEAAFDYGSNVWVVDEDYSRREVLIGITEDELAAMTKAQILSTGGSGTLTINYGNSGLNKIAVLSAPTIKISGSGTFTNEDMTLHQYEFTRRWIRVEDESSGDDDFVTWASINPNRKSWDGNPDDCGGACNWDDWNPGAGWVRSEHVAAGSFPGWLQDWARDRSVDGAIRSGGVVEKRFGAGIFATDLTITGGTLNNVSSPSPTSVSGARVGTARTGSTTVPAPVSVNPFPGLSITLPTNPNGYFVPSKNSDARFLVETNPLFNVGSNFVGSDYLAVRLGINPDTVQKRLGDANYEGYLIRQQLIEQTGNNVLKGYADEATQMQRLMDQGAAQGAALGLTFGQPLTADQVANLKEDMVWMVETVVGGQKVLAPVVYLASSTRDAIEGGAVIAGTNVKLDVASLNNTGGTISGEGSLDVKSKGDITNLSGNIKGGDVSLVSTEGSIKNETFAQGAGDDAQYRTEIGKTAGITANGNLNMDAAKDITVKGANVNAAGDASLAAGNNVIFDTIVDKSAETTYSTSRGLFSSSSQSTNTITTTNIGSNLGTGGNLTIKSGNDTTIAGSNVDVGGNLKVDTEGDFNVISRQDTKETNTKSSTSGLGVGGGLYGTSETVTNNFQGRNAASSLNVGGNADIKTANTMTVQGSNIDIGGNANIKANDVQILAGQDVDRTTSTTTTTTFLKIEGPKGDTNASAGAGAGAGANSMARGGNASAGAGASAQAGAQAGASGSVGLSLAETSTTNTFDLSQRSVGSSLNIGGNLAVDSNKSITLQGAKVDVGGDADLKAKDIKVLAAQDVNISTSKTTTTSIGIYVDSNNSAQAGASAGAGANAYANSSADANGRGGSAGAGASAHAGAQANASASSDTNIDVMRTKTTESESLNITNTGSVINVGGKLNATAENKLTVQGSDISGEKGVSVKAKDMEFLAAEDVSYSSTKTTTVSAGLYITGNASADAGAKASVQADAAAEGGMRGGLNQGSAQASVSGSASAEAGAGASAKIGAGVQTRTNTTTTTEGSTTARVSTIRSGSGDVERIAENRILDVGTAIEAGGDFTQSATTIDSLAARNTSFSTTESESHSARVGVYLQGNAEARASASADGNAGAGYLGGNTMSANSSAKADAGANVSAGIEAEYNMDKSKSSSSSSQAVVSTIRTGGKVSSTSTGTTTFEGTQIDGGTGVDLAAKDINFKAARDTETSSESGTNVNARANIGVNLGSDGMVEGSVGGGFGNNNATSSSSTAVVGSIQSGGNLNIKTQGDARFEGTNINASGDASVAAGGNLQFDAARNTSSSTSNESNAEASLSFSKSGGGGKDESSKGMGLAAAGGFSNEKSSSSEAVTGSINAGGNLTLSAGNNATFEGTNLKAGGDTDIAAGGNVNFNEARNTSNSESTNFSASLELGKSNSSNAKTGESSSSQNASFGAEGGYSKERASEAVTGSIESGGNLRVRSGGDTTFVGTDIAAGGAAAVNAGGNVNFKAAESTAESTNVGGSIGFSGSNSTTTPGKSEAPAAAGAKSTASEPAGPSTERERSGSIGIEAGYSTETERKGGSIAAGSGLQISAGRNANFEGTQVSAGGDASVSAGGDVNITTARSTSSSIGGSIGMEGEKKTNSGDATKDSSSRSGSIGIEGGRSVTHEGASLESGGTLTIASGGKTTMVNTATNGAEGTVIAAAGGVSRSTVSDSDLSVKVSAAGSAEKSGDKPAAPAAEASKPQEKADAAKNDAAKPATPKTEAEKKEAAKKEAAKKAAAAAAKSPANAKAAVVSPASASAKPAQ
ncbi:MAG: hemagglutinin repeat-containing protein, partial [Oxalicibacterium faecigallinarum]|uniref:hemagglutinin repeat-containing protein n=1 Tax=Oxalicibacterium faecigallinarum TaxID=573741 RepID=UPI00280A2C4B